MEKIIIVTIPLKKQLESLHYVPKGRFMNDYPHKVHYAINAFLAQNLTKEDHVKVILLLTEGGDNAGDENAKIFIDELNEINAQCGAVIEKPEIIKSDFELTDTKFHKIFLNLTKQINYKAKIYVDFTFGHKANPILLMSALEFAEKYHHSDVKNIIYGRVEFKDNKINPDKAEIYDFSSLYGLFTLSNIVQASSAEEHLQAIDTFFTM